MKTTKQLLGAVSVFALVAMSSTPAMAAGTRAGNTITNNVTVSYNVSGVSQTDATASDTFTVDQRVNVTVTNVGSATSVAPNQTNRVLAFDVTNSSNNTVDLNLSVALRAGTAANIGNFRVFRDTNGNRVLDAGELSAGAITYLDEVAEDATVAVLVVSDISINARNGDNFDVALTAAAHGAGTTGSLGTRLTATAGANTSGIDTVLFDGAGVSDSANDGAFSAQGRYSVAGAVLTVSKTSRIISDPVNGTGAARKAIPGAVIEYCITVANAAGAATATNVGILDDLPADVTYLSSFGIFVNGDSTCANGTAGGTFAAGAGASGRDRITGSLSDVAASQTRSAYFRVTIK
ncbi:hypothetical protein ACLBKU_17310 [Erythrobacter sp. NE805]|uniref:hypothetical protein n=1 Tax=Erythrobacter sp. NE805 TaxID=3389875 RepID=UPI00396B3DA7